MFYEALFQPQNLEEYNDEAKMLIGKMIPLQGGFIPQEGPYKGHQCFYIANSKMGLIPYHDLQGIRSIGLRRWQEIHRYLGFSE